MDATIVKVCTSVILDSLEKAGMILSSAWMSWSHRVVPLTNLLPFLPNFLIDREPRRECLAVVHLFGKRDVKLAELDTDCDFEHSCSHK